MLKDMLNLIYYNIKHAKLTPNAKKIAKKCELVNFKFKIVSIKIMKKPQVHYTGTETIKYNTDTPKPVYQAAPNQLDSAYAASRCRLPPTKNAITKVPASKLAEPCHHIFDLACSLPKVSL